MAATALVVRSPSSPTTPALTKRRAGRNNGRIGARQVGFGVAGAVGAAAATAALCSFFGMRPQWAGAATGAIGAAGAALTKTGSSVRPFAAGAALGGSSIALTSALMNLEATKHPPKKTDGKPGTDTPQLDTKQPELVNAPPPGARDVNPNGAYPPRRSAPSVTDDMRAQIGRAMRETRFHRG